MKCTAYSFIKYELADVVGINLFQTEDGRGRMIKDYSKEAFSLHGINFSVKESMYIYSKKSVIRGLHFQEKKGQPKIVQCITGNVWAAVVDVNPARKTFGKWETIDINHGKAVFIPGDYAFGTLAIEDSVIACKYGEKYFAEFDTGIKWNDPTVGIQWPIHLIGNPIISEKDENLQSFYEYANRRRRKEKNE